MPLDMRGFENALFQVGRRHTIFEIADEDLSQSTQYYGYINARSQFVIQQRNAATGAYRYYAGRGIATSYATAWAARASNPYVTYPNLVFNP